MEQGEPAGDADQSTEAELQRALAAAQAGAPRLAIPAWDRCHRTPWDHTACLPPGRYLTTDDAVLARLVTPWAKIDDRRRHLWSTYQARAAILEDMLAGPYDDWISGSFTTDKTTPGDLDIVSVVPLDTWNATPRADRDSAQQGFGAVQSDDYDWFLIVAPQEGATEMLPATPTAQRASVTGFWDNLWGSHKNGGRRGYLMLRKNHEH